MSYNDLVDRLMQAVGATAEKVPPGWFTPADFRQKTGKCDRMVSDILSQGVKLGLLEKRKFRIINPSYGCLYPTVFYREIKKK